MGDEIKEFGGWIVAIITIVSTFVYNNRKVQVDESALVLGQWRALVENHQGQIAVMAKEITDLRERLGKAEMRIRDLEDENAGLKRAIAQNSQSAVYNLTKVATQDKSNALDIADLQSRLDEAGHNSERKGDST